MHNFISNSGSKTIINYDSGSGWDFLTGYGSGSTSQKITVPVRQRCFKEVLDSIEQHRLLSPLLVVSTLSTCPTATLGVVRFVTIERIYI